VEIEDTGTNGACIERYAERSWIKTREGEPVMNYIFNSSARRWFVACGLVLCMSITSVGFVQAAGLTEAETSWLTYMREEEKLARDVYIFLYGIWGTNIFNNISGSEQTHMNAVKTLLTRYGVPDPAAGKEQGVFTNQDLQTLYYQLIDDGSVSLVEALKVGIFIEETDINDLNMAIAATAHKDIKTVYANLRSGSYNHLNAFNSNLAKRR